MPTYNPYSPIEDEASRRFNENMAALEDDRRARGTMPTTTVGTNGASPGKNLYGRTPQEEENYRASREGRSPVLLSPQVLASDAPGAAEYQAGAQRVSEQMGQMRTAAIEKRDRRRRLAVGYATSLSALNADPKNPEAIALATEAAKGYTREVLANLGEGWDGGISNKGFERRYDGETGQWDRGIPVVFENKTTGEKMTKFFSMGSIRNAYRKDSQFNEQFGNSAAAMFNNMGIQYALANGFNQAALGKRLSDLQARGAAQGAQTATSGESDPNEKNRSDLIANLTKSNLVQFQDDKGVVDPAKIVAFANAIYPPRSAEAQPQVAVSPLDVIGGEAPGKTESSAIPAAASPVREAKPPVAADDKKPEQVAAKEDVVEGDAPSQQTPKYSTQAQEIISAVEEASKPLTLAEVQRSSIFGSRETQADVDRKNSNRQAAAKAALDKIDNDVRKSKVTADGTFEIPEAENELEARIYNSLGLVPGMYANQGRMNKAIAILDEIKNGPVASPSVDSNDVESVAQGTSYESSNADSSVPGDTGTKPVVADKSSSAESSADAEPQNVESDQASVDVSGGKPATMSADFENNDIWRIAGRKGGLANYVRNVEDGESYEVQKLKSGQLVGVSNDGKIVRDMNTGKVLSGQEAVDKILERKKAANNVRLKIANKSNVGIATAKSTGVDMYKGDMDSAWKDFSEFKLPDLGDSFEDDPDNEGFNEYKRGVLNKQFGVLFESGLTVDQRKRLIERARTSNGFDAKLGYLMTQSLDNLGLFARQYKNPESNEYKSFALQMIYQLVDNGLRHGNLTKEIVGKLDDLPEVIYDEFGIDHKNRNEGSQNNDSRSSDSVRPEPNTPVVGPSNLNSSSSPTSGSSAFSGTADPYESPYLKQLKEWYHGNADRTAEDGGAVDESRDVVVEESAGKWGRGLRNRLGFPVGGSSTRGAKARMRWRSTDEEKRAMSSFLIEHGVDPEEAESLVDTSTEKERRTKLKRLIRSWRNIPDNPTPEQERKLLLAEQLIG